MAAALEICGKPPANASAEQKVETAADEALATLLHRAISTTEDASREEVMARATMDFRRQTFSECSFRDDIWEPALEFMAIMGLGPADVFRKVLAGFHGLLTQQVEESPRGVLEQILPELFPYCESHSMRRLLILILRRLAELPRYKGAANQAIEDNALSCLARNLSGEAERELIPAEIQRQLPSGCNPETFPEVVLPVVSDAIEWLHCGTGVGLAEEALRALSCQQASELRSHFHSVRRLADLVGPSCDLYRILRKLISEKAHEAVSSLHPMFRRKPLKGEVCGAPVSLGPEPFLSTLHSQLLLVMVERQILQKSLSGTWNISSQTAGKPHVFQYVLHISHHGVSISGKSTLMQGFDIDGEVSTTGCSLPGGQFLSFRQESPKQVYTCTCEVTANLKEICNGKWRNKDGTVAGSFTGRRVGVVSYADCRGQVWDETAHLVVLLDSMHGKRAGLDDELCEELQQVASQSCASRREAAQPGAQPAGCPMAGPALDLEASARHLLADMNVVHSLIRTVVYWRKQKANDALRAPLDHRERLALFLLLWSVHAITSHPCVNTLQPAAPKRKLQLSGARHQLDDEGILLRAPIFEQLHQGPPSEEALSKAGLRGDLLAASLWSFFQPSHDADVGAPEREQPTARLRQALEIACADLPRCQTAYILLRLANNYMANYAIIRRSTSLLQESLALARDFDPVPHGQSPDWVTRQLVDILVNSGIYLGTFFDVDVRGAVTDYLIPLAKVDGWIHWRLAELLKVALTTGISMVREQMKLLSVLLTDGVRVDEHYDWTARLAKAYNSIAQVRIHLQELFRMSDLGKIALEDTTDASETQCQTEALTTKPSFASTTSTTEESTDRRRAGEIEEAVREDRDKDGLAVVRPSSSTSDTPNVEHPEQVSWEWQKWAQTLLETEDGILAPSVDTAVRVFVEEGDWQERAGMAARLLQAKFTRSHCMCHKGAEWLLKLQAARETPSSQENQNERAQCAELEVFEDEQQLLTKYLLIAMEAAFDMEKADKVFLIDHSSEGSADQRSKSSDLRRGILEDFLSAFIKVPQFRQLIYTLSGQSLRTQASVFLSAMLRVICTSAEVKEGLKEVMDARVYAMNYIVFERTLQDKIRDFFQVVAEASKPVAPTRLSDNALGPALAEICQVCNFSEYTYFYSQAHLCCLAAAQKPLKDIFRHISEALTRTMKATKGNRIWLLDMRFRGLGCHRKLFEELASIFMRWGKCEVTPHAAKTICGLLEDLLCPEVKRAWQKVKGETTGASSEQRSLQDALGGWQRSFFSPPATRALMEWMFFNVRPENRHEAARAAGWMDDTSEPQADKRDDVVDGVDAGSSGDGEEPKHEEDAVDEGSDGARTEAAGEEMDWEDLDEDFLLEQAAKDEPETEISQPETEISQPARSDASRSKRSGMQSSGRQTRNSRPSQMPSVLTASGYRMHAVSSQDAESNRGPVRRGQDLEDIGAQSVLEFFRNPDFVEAVVRAFLKARHTKSTRSCFCRLLALITTDGLLEEENSKDEAKKPVSVAQTAVRELMAIYTQVQQKSKCIGKPAGKDSPHERKPWSQDLYVMMHLQATAVASLAGMIWLREEVLSPSLPQDELIERMSSGLPFMLLQRVAQRHPQKGEEVLSVLKHMMVLVGKDLIPEKTGLEGAHRPETHHWGGGEEVGHSRKEAAQEEDEEWTNSWEAKKAALEEARDRICGHIASMLLYLVMAHQLLLPILNCLHEVRGALCPAALQLFLTEMLTVRPACERVFWAMARFLAQPEVLSLLGDEWPQRDEVCIAVERFCLAYDEVNTPARLPDQDGDSSPPQVLQTAREETQKNVKLVQANLRKKSEEPLLVAAAESKPPAGMAPEARPQAVDDSPGWSASTLWSWFTGGGKTRRGARAAPTGKQQKSAAKRQPGGSKKKKRTESSVSSSESSVMSGEGTPPLRDDEEDSRSDEDEIDLDAILGEGASALSASAASLSQPQASQASSMVASKPRKADNGKRRKTGQERHHRREGDRGSRRRTEDRQEARSDLETCSVANASDLQSDSFARAFAGMWQVYFAEESSGVLRKGSCWGKAQVVPESCHFSLPSGKRYPFKVHGEGSDVSPYALISEKGNATLIDHTPKVLTWKLKKGHTMWLKEVAQEQPDNITELASVAAEAASYTPEPLAPGSLLCQSPETPPSPVPLEAGQDVCTSPRSQPVAPEGHERSASGLSSAGVSTAPTPGSVSALSSLAVEGLAGSGLMPQSVALAGTAPASQLPRSASSVSNTPTESAVSAPQPKPNIYQTAKDEPPAPRRHRSLRIRVTNTDETPRPVSTKRPRSPTS